MQTSCDPFMLPSNKRLEFARIARPTRKGDAPLLAAQPRRWASMILKSIFLVGGTALILGCPLTRARADAESTVLNEIVNVCGDGWIFSLPEGTNAGAPIEALRDAFGLIYGGERGTFEGVEFESIAVVHPSSSEARSLLETEWFRRALGVRVISALRRVLDTRKAFYAMPPTGDENGDLLGSDLAKQYFSAQREAEALLRKRFIGLSSPRGSLLALKL